MAVSLLGASCAGFLFFYLCIRAASRQSPTALAGVIPNRPTVSVVERGRVLEGTGL